MASLCQHRKIEISKFPLVNPVGEAIRPPTPFAHCHVSCLVGLSASSELSGGWIDVC